MPNATTMWKPIEAWATRHRLLLGAFGHVLAFAVLFGGVALAATTSDFAGTAESIVLGLVAIGLVKLLARSIPATQRLIDTLHPEPDFAKTGAFPNWALAIYALVGIALILTVVTLEGRPTHAAAELFAAFAAGRHVLAYYWTRRINPEHPKALDIIDDWLDATAEPYRPMLRALGTTLCFALLFGGVALYAWQAGITRVAAAACGPACATGFEFLVAAGCGAAAILFVTLYTRLTLAAQRVFIDPLQFVRPEPKPEKAAKWVTVLHVVLGFILLFVMTGVGEMTGVGQVQVPHRIAISADTPEAAGLLLGWWLGGGVVLRFFWAKWRRGETPTRPAPAEPHRMQS
jgi:hypothetical protein